MDRSAGFTLVEFLITITILAILMVLVIPSFQTMLMNSRISAQVNGLVNALNFARTTALTQNMSVQVCPIGATNSTTCGSNWGQGWIVVTQPSTGTATLLQSFTISANNPVLSATGISSVSFNSRGLTAAQANFKICDSRGSAYAQSVEVLTTGFVQAGDTAGQAVWGGALTCP